jgi:hypothetical protein
METVKYSGIDGVVNWCGISLEQNEEYNHFMQNDVAARLYDQQGGDEFKIHLRGLASTGFAQDSLDAILAAEIPEQRDWAVGEAFAEAWLSKNHGVVWPWNLERDKRTPKASLPGADLIGFIQINNETRLLIGEVKTSSDTNTPPNVMNGHGGMIYQLDKLVTELNLIFQLLRWLQPRCKNTDYEHQFNAAVGLLLHSGNKSIAIFGILIRDTTPSETDLKKRAESLAKTIQAPTICQLQAIYLPHSISSLPSLVSNEVQS